MCCAARQDHLEAGQLCQCFHLCHLAVKSIITSINNMLSLALLAGKAIWKLDDPAVLAAERAERQAAAAEAARRKLANALDKKVRVFSFCCFFVRQKCCIPCQRCRVGSRRLLVQYLSISYGGQGVSVFE
jgi:hypothetical protein